MTVICITLPDFRHSHFHLTVKLEAGELEPQDELALDGLLRDVRRLARRLSRLDAQTSPQ